MNVCEEWAPNSKKQKHLQRMSKYKIRRKNTRFVEIENKTKT